MGGLFFFQQLHRGQDQENVLAGARNAIGGLFSMLTLYNKKSSANGTLKWAKLYENKQIIYNQSMMLIQDQLPSKEIE